jgi:1,4-alpha-glucan branching enzyme
MQGWVAELNRLLRAHPALAGTSFEWLDCDDRQNSVVSWVRRGASPGDDVVVIANFTPTPHDGYRVGLPRDGRWRIVANSDEERWGGSGYPTAGAHQAQDVAMKQWSRSAMVSLPPLAMLVLVCEAS